MLNFQCALGAFDALIIHWFNPFMWLAFMLMSRDMEMSCDERVIKELDYEERAEYGLTLVNLAMNSSTFAGGPLAFGGSGTKKRVKNILKYKKPMLWTLCIIVPLVIVIAAALIANPVKRLALPDTSSIASIEIDQNSGQEIVESVSIDEDSDINLILSRLDEAKRAEDSMNDYPAQSDYITIRFKVLDSERILYLYSDENADYIEEPYVGIYKISNETREAIYRVFTKAKDLKEYDIVKPVPKKDSAMPSDLSPTMPGSLPKVYSKDPYRNEPFMNAKLLPEVYWDTYNKTDFPIEGPTISIPSGRPVFAFLPTRPHESKSIVLGEETLENIIAEAQAAKVLLEDASDIDWTKVDFQDYGLILYTLTDGEVYNEIYFRGPIYYEQKTFVDLNVSSIDSGYAFETWRIESDALAQILLDTWGPKFELERFNDVVSMDMRVLGADGEGNAKGNTAFIEGDEAREIAKDMLRTTKILTGYGKCPYNIEIKFTFFDGTTELGWLNGDSCTGIAMDNGPNLRFNGDITKRLYRLLDYGEGYVD